MTQLQRRILKSLWKGFSKQTICLSLTFLTQTVLSGVHGSDTSSCSWARNENQSVNLHTDAKALQVAKSEAAIALESVDVSDDQAIQKQAEELSQRKRQIEKEDEESDAKKAPKVQSSPFPSSHPSYPSSPSSSNSYLSELADFLQHNDPLSIINSLLGIASGQQEARRPSQFCDLGCEFENAEPRQLYEKISAEAIKKYRENRDAFFQSDNRLPDCFDYFRSRRDFSQSDFSQVDQIEGFIRSFDEVRKLVTRVMD